MSIFSWVTNLLKSLFSKPSPTIVRREPPYRQVREGFRTVEILIRVNRGTEPGSADSQMESRSHPSRQGDKDITDETVVILIKEFTKAEVTEMGGRLGHQALVQWGAARGWLVANRQEMEAIGADPQTRALQRERLIVGCGTIVRDDDEAYVWAVGWHADTDAPYLVSAFAVLDYRQYRYAFVRKAPA